VDNGEQDHALAGDRHENLSSHDTLEYLHVSFPFCERFTADVKLMPLLADIRNNAVRMTGFSESYGGARKLLKVCIISFLS
jgi:hypothetical protein